MTEQALTADTLHAPGLRLWDYEQLLSAQLQPREMLLAPWLPEKSLCMLYAARGIGKTYLALSTAHAVASGGNIKLVIVDNLSSLVRSGKENEAESWIPIQEWALSLKRKGVSVLFIHHSSRSGTQRGTSRREDLLDTLISLRRLPLTIRMYRFLAGLPGRHHGREGITDLVPSPSAKGWWREALK